MFEAADFLCAGSESCAMKAQLFTLELGDLEKGVKQLFLTLKQAPSKFGVQRSTFVDSWLLELVV